MIVFDKVSKEFFGGARAVDELSFEVVRGETLVLLGTSGCGKTTSLKMINRLIEPTSGRIMVDDKNNLEAPLIELRRNIGYAIQHIGLFPHMTVYENIAVTPRLLKWTEDDVSKRADTLLEMVGLEPGNFRDRYPSELSGGQMQRIGVARALAADPPIVLMDEPFGALDPITREKLQNEFLELLAELQKTVIFVTHDVFEAVKLGDRIALLDQGKLQQIAKPARLVEEPANQFVDSFLGPHRFQLALLTRRIKTLFPDSVPAEGEPDKPEHFIKTSNSIIEAMDAFKVSKKSSLPVYERGKKIGELNKKDLLSLISDIFEEGTES